MANTGIVQPTYEVIKKEDMTAAFRDGLEQALIGILERLNALIDLYSSTANSSLWTWGVTSRWDFDMWW